MSTAVLERRDARSGGLNLRWYWLLLIVLMFMAIADLAVGGPRKTITVVDDDPDLLSGVVDILSEVFIPGVDFDVFPSCEALQAVMSVGMRYRTYVTDTDLGRDRMDGFACVSMIKSLDPLAVVVAASARMDADRITRYRALGVDEIIEKPASYIRWFFNFIAQ